MSDVKDGKKTTEKVRKLQEKHVPEQVLFDNAAANAPQKMQGKEDVEGLAEKDVMAEQFPASYADRDPRDEVMAAKLDLQKETGQKGVTPFGVMEAQDDDFKWLLQKQAAAEQANLEKWFAEEFDRMDPASKEWARETMPDFYAKREKLLKTQTENLHRLAKVKLNGIQSYEDLLLMYAASTGRLDLGPVKHLLNPHESGNSKESVSKSNFNRGLLNPRRYYFGFPGVASRQYNAAAGFKANMGTDMDVGLKTGFPPASKYGMDQTAGTAPLAYKQTQ